ncbi:MAG TPA: AAA family ATPase [Ktedonobacteraceae bacterium]|nr:AAA family ATPase [Ktedonobacteraceae bacterium]
MFNVCPQCGEYCVEKTIDPAGPFAVCPFCQHAHPFLQQPLFIITGPSGAGKTTVCLALTTLMNECVIIESDILWGLLPATAENNYSEYRNVWLRIAKNIGQAGRPVALCGTAIPEQFEACPERRYFSTLYYLAIVCDDALLEERLKLRPQWRESGSGEVIERMLQFNRWLKEHATTTKPAMTLYDNSHRSIQETTSDVAQWIRERL